LIARLKLDNRRVVAAVHKIKRSYGKRQSKHDQFMDRDVPTAAVLKIGYHRPAHAASKFLSAI
jgi:hypothetical protein